MANMQNGTSIKDAISVTANPGDKPSANGHHDTYQTNGDGVVVITTTTTPSNHPSHEHGLHLMSEHELDVLETQRNVERIARDWGVDSIDDVNAATAMLALKHGPKVFAETFQTGYVCAVVCFCVRWRCGGNLIIFWWLFLRSERRS